MNIVSVFIGLLCLHSSVLSQDQENDNPLYNEDFIKKLKSEKIYFIESFNNKESFLSTWTVSQALKATEDGGNLKYDGDWILEEAVKDSLPNDIGLTFKDKAKHRAISSKLNKDFVFYDKPFILQYEVLLQDGQECGGAYLKLLSKQSPPVKPLSDFNDKTPYTIMFGPDKCGAVNKLHFIFRHKNPLNGSLEEKHSKPPKSKIDESFSDAKPHLFKLIIKPDNTFSVSLDHKVINDGSLLEDFNPPVNPPLEIDDPTDKKPSDWDDREKIHDPLARKPENWDETAPYQIPDPNAVKPEDWLEDELVNISDPSAEKPDDWDNEMDGEWEAPLVPNPVCEDVSGCGPWSPPLINNPEYRGKWVAPLINNPDYRGVWTPKKIPNPNYFEDRNPFQMSSIDSLGFELWSMSAKILFDNIIITDDDNIAKQFAAFTFDRKIVNIEKSAETVWAKMMVSLNHKPGWWSLYFLYCFIPIAIYVWYLWRRVKEDTLLNQFIAFTNQYPWLWALYVVILLIPVTLIVVCCFWTTKDTEAEHKKDDDDDQEIDVVSLTLPPSLIDESKEGEGIQEENQTDENMDTEAEHKKDDDEDQEIDVVSLTLPPSLIDESKEGEGIQEENQTHEKMEFQEMTSEGAENEPEFVLKQRKQHTTTH